MKNQLKRGRKPEAMASPRRMKETLLAQRQAFLRPDSLVAVIMLSDENDCSIAVGGSSWIVGNTRRPMNRGEFYRWRQNVPSIIDAIEAIDDESSHVIGNLTMHGVTQEVKLKTVVQGTDIDPWDNERVGLHAVGVLNRSDFDMKFNQALGSGNVLVGDKVNLSLDISAVKQG